MRRIRVYVCIVQVCLFGLSKTMRAAGNIHMGALEIHPLSAVEHTFNDNIYSEPKNQANGDQITIYQLGLLLSRPIKPGRDFIFKARYVADFLQYNKYDIEDRTDHTVDASADFTFAKNLTLKLKEDFKKTADPPNSELTKLEKRLRNNSIATLGLKGERMGLEVAYQFARDNYDTLNNLDKKEIIVSPIAYLNIGTKTSLLFEFNTGKIEYDNVTTATRTNNDSDYTQWRAGIKGSIAPKVTGVLKGGYKKTDYEDTRTLTERDFNGSTLFGNLTYALKQRSTLNIHGDRSLVESTFDTNNYYRLNKIGGQLDHQLMKRIFVLGGGYFQRNKYPEEVTYSGLTDKRTDKLQGANAGLRYEIREWLIVEGKYEYRKKDSNFNDFDYKTNIYSGKLSLVF